MADIKVLAARFHALFAGMERAHGTYNKIGVDTSREDGKLKGKAYTLRQPVTDELWEGHLNGTNGIGIIPIRDDDTAVFGAIDLDIYNLNHVDIVAQLAKHKLPLILCRSKSGGGHAYLFTKAPVTALRMKTKLQEIAAFIGHGTAEIFPKQVHIAEESLDQPNWINMPYFAAQQTTRYGFSYAGDALSPEEFLTLADKLKVEDFYFNDKDKEKKEKTLGETHLPDGPPCLQHLMTMGFPPGGWNVGMFNVGMYCRKAFPVDWETKLVQINAINFPPETYPVSDLKDMIASLRKKNYQYECSKAPLASYCNSVQCRRRKYGVGGIASGFPVLGELRKLLTQPPVYFLDVQNDEGEFIQMELTVSELRSPRMFGEKLMGLIDRCPAMPKDDVWIKQVDALLKEVKWLEAPPEDSSAEGQFWETVEQFCSKRAHARTRDEIVLGKPYTEEGRTYFRMQDLLRHMKDNHIKDIQVQQITKMLKMRVYEGKPYTKQNKWHICNNSRFVNLWSVPEFKRDVEPLAMPDEVKKDERQF